MADSNKLSFFNSTNSKYFLQKFQGLPFALIYPTYPRTNPWNFHTKYWELPDLKNSVFWVGHFDFFFLNSDFFASSPWKSTWLSYKVSFTSALWMVSSESWKILHTNSFAHDCTWSSSLSKKSHLQYIWHIFVIFDSPCNLPFNFNFLHGNFVSPTWNIAWTYLQFPLR